MMKDFSKILNLFSLEDFDCHEVEGHEGGRNRIFVCSKGDEKKFVLRISTTGDRTEKDYLAETEFVHYLAANGAPVADVIPSVNGKLVEVVDGGDTDWGEGPFFVSLFEYAKGMLLCDNGYRYREGAPLEDYFLTTGKTIGKIHELSKRFKPVSNCRRPDYFDKYNMEYINRLIPDASEKYVDLKKAIAARLEKFRQLPMDAENYGLVHFDFSDGNYHIDMSNGDITVFDFDNCMYCWYMFDLANLYLHSEGWFRGESDPAKKDAGMRYYFDILIAGYKSETEISSELLIRLPLFVSMVLIENIVDEFECAVREGEEVDFEDIEEAANHLIK
ncbi:MAG: phosphotransferase [Treponema sp.]|nr:phosphotransferase [Treponema sp.]